MRLVVPTSRSRAPALCTISGMRKPSPISTSWPRETTISRPPASAASASTSAAAPLLTQIAASAPVSSQHAARRRGPGASRARRSRGRARGSSSPRPTACTCASGGLGERRAPEVGVQDDARGVEHRAQRRLERGAHAPAQLGRERCRRRLLAARAPLGQRGARLAHAERVRGVARRLAHEDVYGRQGARHGRIVGRLRAGEAVRKPAVHCPPGGRRDSDRVQRRRPEAATRGSADFLERRRCGESTGDAAVWPAEPRARAPAAGAASASASSLAAARDPARASRPAARCRRRRRARRRRPPGRRVARRGRARDRGGRQRRACSAR